jgi:hypothetical protein
MTDHYDAAAEREERRALARSLFADDLARAAQAATRFDELFAALLTRAEPQDRARLIATVNRYDTYIVAEELTEWADALREQG